MKTLQYPTYRQSGVPWLGAIPSGWTAEKVKRTSYLKARVGWKGLTSDEYLDEGYAYLVSGTDFSGKYIDWSVCHQIDEARFLDDPFIQLRNGDLLVTKDGTIGKLALVSSLDKPACLNSGIFLLRPTGAYVTEFMYWVLQSDVFTGFVELRSQGSTIQHLYQNVFEEFVFPAPPRSEQIAIAAFLNNEIRKVDALIEEQERLIELLNEKRNTFVADAVTKGLRKDVATTHCTTPWPCLSPVHWELRPLRSLSSIVRGASPRPAGDPRFFDGNFIHWVTVAEITKDESMVLTATERFLTAEGAEQSRCFKAGTVIYTNSGATLGVPKILEIDACGNDGIVGFEQLSPLLSPQYLYHFLRSLTSKVRDVAQGSGQPNLNTGIVKAIVIALPPLDEQLEICVSIRALETRLVSLVAEARTAIALLKERRGALITDAVTGKIDVRGYQLNTVTPSAAPQSRPSAALSAP